MALICNEYTDDVFPSSHSHAYIVTKEKMLFSEVRRYFRSNMKTIINDIERPTNFRETARYVTKYDRQACVLSVPLKFTSTTWRAALYARHHRAVSWGDQIPSTIASCDRKIFSDVVMDETRLSEMEIITERTQVDLLPWQIELKELISADDRSRTVYWVVDVVGGGGKSLMSQVLMREFQGIIFNDFHYRDNSYLYNSEATVIFDIPRDVKLEECSLQFIEDLKNGYIISQKYEVRRKVFNIPHVIVFSKGLW